MARELVAVLNAEFGADRLRFSMRTYRGRLLELGVWPEGGLDTFECLAETPEQVQAATQEFRRVASLYAAGERPPFDE